MEHSINGAVRAAWPIESRSRLPSSKPDRRRLRRVNYCVSLFKFEKMKIGIGRHEMGNDE